MIKKDRWLLYLFLNIITCGLFTFYLAQKIKVYDKNAWYSNVLIWLFAFLFGIWPFIIMLFVFFIKTACLVSKAFNVPYSNYYSYPYIWLILFITPIIGWSLFVVLFLYVNNFYIIYIKRGYGEKIELV